MVRHQIEGGTLVRAHLNSQPMKSGHQEEEGGEENTTAADAADADDDVYIKISRG